MPVELEKSPPMSPERHPIGIDRSHTSAAMARRAMTIAIPGVDRPELTTYYTPRRKSAQGVLLAATHPDQRALSGVGAGLDFRRPFQRNIDNSADVIDAIASRPNVLSEDDRRITSEQTLNFLRRQSLRLSAPVAAGSEGKEAFDTTQRDRKMFEAGSGGSSSHESYATELFAGTLTPEIKDHIAESLDGKVVFNLGGGNSRIAEELAEHGAHTEVLNIEPYASDRAREGQGSGYDHLLEENPAAEDFLEKSELPLHSADEIWAVYSVPAYLGSEQEVTNLFENATNLIKPGGIIRISHLGIVDAVEGDPRVTSLLAQLEKAKDQGFLLEQVKTTRGITLLMTAPEMSQS